MPMPWMQFTVELMNDAPEFAVRLEVEEDTALACLVRAVSWAVQRVPKDVRPSAFAEVRGPKAAELIARAARFDGDARAFCEALCALPHAPLERIEGGYRFRGLDRYDSAWRKNRGEPDDGPNGNRTGTGGKPGGDRTETGGKRKRKTEKKTETNTPPSAAEDEAPPPPPSEQLLRLMAEVRRGNGLEPEPELQPSVADGLRFAVEKLGEDVVFASFCNYLSKPDKGAAAMSPAFPLALFLKQFDRHHVTPPPPREPCAVFGCAEECGERNGGDIPLCDFHGLRWLCAIHEGRPYTALPQWLVEQRLEVRA